MNEVPDSLLAADEPAPVTVHNANGRSLFLIVADHAGNSMPRALHRLGVPETESKRHIAWDIGVAGLCRVVADALDATLVQQNYSRLVIDCNRTPGSETSILESSELTPIPGNIGLSEGQKVARIGEIVRPYHDRFLRISSWRCGHEPCMDGARGVTISEAFGCSHVSRPMSAAVLRNALIKKRHPTLAGCRVA